MKKLPHLLQREGWSAVVHKKKPHKRQTRAPNNEAVQIREHVEKCTGLKAEVVKLETKHDTYSSFHVKATCENPSVFVDDGLWPEGVRYRWFKPARANQTKP